MEWCFTAQDDPSPPTADASKHPLKSCLKLRKAALLYVKDAGELPFFKAGDSVQPRGPIQLNFHGRPQPEQGNGGNQAAANQGAPPPPPPPNRGATRQPRADALDRQLVEFVICVDCM
jgi:hypothetical protein